MSWLKKSLFVASLTWAGPYSCLGLGIGLVGCATGGRRQRKGCVLEFYGGAVDPFLTYVCGRWVSAITLGHTILGRDAEVLERCREHELVHVRQYERWGLFFGPAYLASSAAAWFRGKCPYRDNHFERQAYGTCVRGGPK